ncbi:MAG: ATP-binding protein [bacterium]|nr:ATP-binding protein [bacterium]
MARKKIKGNFGTILTYLGRLYGTPANAIKEYVSNALDEWVKNKDSPGIENVCRVHYKLEKNKITIDYNSPGMDGREFATALNSVAESAKKESTLPQIGELGIGIFAFNQIGSTCTFLSKKSNKTPTIKVSLASNSEEYDIQKAKGDEYRRAPGMTIIITRLHHDPTKPRGSLSPGLLQRFLSEKFDSYIRNGNLQITITCSDKVYEVKPLEILLPEVGVNFREMNLLNDEHKSFQCQFWYDSSGKSDISIRHTSVTIVESLKSLPSQVLTDSVYTTGYLKGFINADFLKPLPSRTSFEENEDWIAFLIELERIIPALEGEVEKLRKEEQAKKLTDIQKRAIELAREILNQEEFNDLELLGGLKRKRNPILKPGVSHTRGVLTGNKSKKQGDPGTKGGPRIAYIEEPFEDGPARHSEFVAGTVRVNTVNPDYVRENQGSIQDKLIYATLMVGKEAISLTARSDGTEHFLEKLLTYVFLVRRKAEGEITKDRLKKKRVLARNTPTNAQLL